MTEWIKVAHILAVISWMAGLLYLPRLMVYHCASAVGSEQSETFKVMERRLLRAIMTPAMAASWAFGLWLATLAGSWGEGWFHLKLGLVLALSAFHLACVRWVRELERDDRRRSQRFFRIANEVPTVLMIGIVIAVVVRPFQ